jgi:DNA-binding IclR family transcriptional regulator
MRLFRDELNETVYIAVRVGDDRINRISSRASATLGKLTPLYVGSTSHVILAALPDEQMAAYIDTTEFVPPFPGAKVDAPILRRAIAEVRRNGYAETHNKRFDEGASISAVVRSSGAEMTGALTVSIAIGQLPAQSAHAL